MCGGAFHIFVFGSADRATDAQGQRQSEKVESLDVGFACGFSEKVESLDVGFACGFSEWRVTC